MKDKTRYKLQEAMDDCILSDKNMKDTIQYMRDSTGLKLECIINFINELSTGQYFCKMCSGILVKTKDIYPYTIEHYICTICDSTYTKQEIEG